MATTDSPRGQLWQLFQDLPKPLVAIVADYATMTLRDAILWAQESGIIGATIRYDEWCCGSTKYKSITHTLRITAADASAINCCLETYHDDELNVTSAAIHMQLDVLIDFIKDARP